MTPEQKAAYVMAMSACVFAEVAAMQAANDVRRACGEAPVFSGQELRDLINIHGIHHNSVLSLFRGG